MYLLYFGDIPNLVSCAFSTIPIVPHLNSHNFLVYLYIYNAIDQKLAESGIALICAQNLYGGVKYFGDVVTSCSVYISWLMSLRCVGSMGYDDNFLPGLVTPKPV